MFTFYILRGVKRRCVWALGRLGIAAYLSCVAAAVDSAGATVLSCLVWPCELQCSFKRAADARSFGSLQTFTDNSDNPITAAVTYVMIM